MRRVPPLGHSPHPQMPPYPKGGPSHHDGALRSGKTPGRGQAFNQHPPLFFGGARGFSALCKTGQRRHTRQRMERKKQSSGRDARRQHKRRQTWSLEERKGGLPAVGGERGVWGRGRGVSWAEGSGMCYGAARVPEGTISYLGFGRSSETGTRSSLPAAPGTEAHLRIDGRVFAGREKSRNGAGGAHRIGTGTGMGGGNSGRRNVLCEWGLLPRNGRATLMPTLVFAEKMGCPV